MADDIEHLALYSTDCLKCSHLVETGTKAFTKCHFKKGKNKECPAKEVRIVIVGKAMRYARRVLKAREDRDAPLEAQLLAEVAKESEAFKSRFYSHLEDGVIG